MENASKSDVGRPVSSILSILGGALMVASGLMAAGMMATWSSIGGMPGYGMGGMMMGGWGMMMSSQFMWGAVGAVSAFTIGLGAVLIVGGYFIQKTPESASKWGTAILIVSIIGLVSMSGFFIGPIVGIIGGVLALTKK